MGSLSKANTVSECHKVDGLLFEFVYPEKKTSDEDLQKISTQLYKLLKPYIDDVDNQNMI